MIERSAVDPAAGALARLTAPLLLLLGLSLLAVWSAGGGVGFVAGLLGLLAVMMHAIVFGAAASRRAFPPVLLRAVLIVALVAAAATLNARIAYALQIQEAAVAAITTAGGALLVMTLFGRAAALRDGAW
jgi:multisubunit Na+/H+ antiporter MnhB subunit